METTLKHETLQTLSHATALIAATQEEQAAFLAVLAVSPFDTVAIDGAVGGGIKEIRTFANQLMMSPQYGDCHLGVITHADKLTPQAQNALLKLLEEPPERVKIVLCIDLEAEVLPTVLSRCRRYYGASVSLKATDASVSYNQNALSQFVAAETLAKDESLEHLAQSWLTDRYFAWCEAGRPAKELNDVTRFWDFYQGVLTQTNKRLLLEQLVVSSL